MLVDWEYSQWADPLWDVACLLEYYPDLQSRSEVVLEACGLDSSEDRQILSLQRAVFASLNGLWGLSEGGAG
jgi:thiamine kinase-like enzyme